MANDDQNIHPNEAHHYNAQNTPPIVGDPAGPLPHDIYASPPNTNTSGQNFNGEDTLYNTNPPNVNSPQKKPSLWRAAFLVMTVIALILAGTTALAYNHIINPPLPNNQIAGGSTVATPTSVVTPAPTSIPTTAPTTGASTPAATSTSVAGQPSTSTANYSAPLPGPGCDTAGGIWTPQGIGNINCDVSVTPSSSGTWGYLYLQLPDNAAFAANNEITISSDSFGYSCFGLAEQGANTGFLAAFCGDGTWSIYSISNKGTIIQTLSQNISAKRDATTLSLSLKNNTLAFTIDQEAHQVTITPLQPIKVAIGVDDPGNDYSVQLKNFSYITPAS